MEPQKRNEIKRTNVDCENSNGTDVSMAINYLFCTYQFGGYGKLFKFNILIYLGGHRFN